MNLTATICLTIAVLLGSMELIRYRGSPLKS
jgi:hypothetical protein